MTQFTNIIFCCLRYLGFNLLFFLISLILISFAAFFHFILGHEFSAIEKWISTSIWELTSLSLFLGIIFFNRMFVFKKKFEFTLENLKSSILKIKLDKVLQLILSWHLGGIVFYFLYLDEPQLSKINFFKFLNYFFYSLPIFTFPVILGGIIRKSYLYKLSLFKEHESIFNNEAFSVLFYYIVISSISFFTLDLISTSPGGASSVIFLQILISFILFELLNSLSSALLWIILVTNIQNIIFNQFPLKIDSDVILFQIKTTEFFILNFSLVLVNLFYFYMRRKNTLVRSVN